MGIGEAELGRGRGLRSGLGDALLNKLWPHLGPSMDTVLQRQPAQHPHLPTSGRMRPKAIVVQKEVLPGPSSGLFTMDK